MLDKFKDEDFDMAGSLLLAHPHLKDPNFVRSVILMTAHEDEGSLGVVVNKSSGQTLGEISNDFSSYGLNDVPLFIGGPVGQDQIILAGWKVIAETCEFKLFFGMQPEAMQAKLEEDPELEVRAFRGYSGWSKGQLTGELTDNAWVVSDMDAYALTKLNGDSLWRHVIMNINLELGLMSLAPEPIEAN